LSSTHDGISRFSTKFSEQLTEDERVVDEEESTFGFLDGEEGAQWKEEAHPVPKDDVEGEKPFSPVQEDVAADETERLGFLTGDGKGRESEAVLTARQLAPEHDAPRSSIHKPFKAQKSRNSRKSSRSSRTMTILDSIPIDARILYTSTLSRKAGLADDSPERVLPGNHRWTSKYSLPLPAALQDTTTSASLHTTLTRYLGHLTAADTIDTPFICTPHEHNLLQHEGLDQEIVQTWASSVLNPYSNCQDVSTRSCPASLLPGFTLSPS
jgi:hypothetical protein